MQSRYGTARAGCRAIPGTGNGSATKSPDREFSGKIYEVDESFIINNGKIEENKFNRKSRIFFFNLHS